MVSRLWLIIDFPYSDMHVALSTRAVIKDPRLIKSICDARNIELQENVFELQSFFCKQTNWLEKFMLTYSQANCLSKANWGEGFLLAHPHKVDTNTHPLLSKIGLNWISLFSLSKTQKLREVMLNDYWISPKACASLVIFERPFLNVSEIFRLFYMETGSHLWVVLLIILSVFYLIVQLVVPCVWC